MLDFCNPSIADGAWMKASTVRTKHIATAVLAIAFSVHAQTTSPAKVDLVPQVTSDLDREAQALYRLGRFDEAGQKYLRLLGEQPKAADAYAGLTRVYLKEKKVQQARDTISKGLEIVDSVSMRVAFGEVLFREGKLAEAENEWLKVIDSRHEDARDHLGLARVSAASTQYAQAKTEIDKAHAIDPNDPDIEFYWLQFLRSSEQVRYLEKYLSDPNGTSPEERAHLRSYLELLRARMGSSTHACRLATYLAPTETDLLVVTGERQAQIRGYSLAVTLNGQNSKLQLDTGASGILIDRRIAEKAGLSKLSDATLGGFGDQADST